ncbi:MAG: hypothetical protein UU73_C0001G0147 [Candidatus Daviesbacteria bacterium GW2011_GWA1_41_61]|uniref:DUF2304 domain-containing protein n=1 Tax=Candidatus Daviesbacteria bacterium GW2011_GWA2_40_9 TaxID=1618424 RepID=A0A0G0U767_9BACT|nr:MAG: hypothetical protein UU26_C0001G0018 [Candidatus Daviesbacteria bacterium GW2011_GWC1_40_9]KKR83041.1 MAG: hypothetical protein UU29_C0008G0150 [Candidatus Daviesbacteria bacterium GW2011_GWA2_40_9]KKR92966.1 MAG: hypothetical protein UU44_C0004G0148 [Candidatus Daviesbacteria bacterium GW2011_GWB1_41_15]KKS15510.1 MAG: hypothetical protein UU73_C0001G0147 [Candidatus Daviesbacteria bacterium GW2011_GWA1_41_61]
MSISQLLLSTIIIFIIYKTALSFKKGNLSKNFTFTWLLLWAGVLFFIFEQNTLIKAAHSVGISRGVDLVIYLSIILLFYLVYRIFYNLNEINQKITKIIREEALRHPLQNSKVIKHKHPKR